MALSLAGSTAILPLQLLRQLYLHGSTNMAEVTALRSHLTKLILTPRPPLSFHSRGVFDCGLTVGCLSPWQERLISYLGGVERCFGEKDSRCGSSRA